MTDHFFAIGDQFPITWPKRDRRSVPDQIGKFPEKVIGDQIAIADHSIMESGNSDLAIKRLSKNVIGDQITK